MEDFFCSELSRRVAEKTFGTASIGHVWILLEYPVAWGAKALESSSLPPKVKNHLSALVKRIPRARLLFIKQSRGCEGSLNLFAAHCHERVPFIKKFQIDTYEQLLEISPAEIASERVGGGAVVTRE